MAVGQYAKRRRSDAAQMLEALVLLGIGLVVAVVVLVWLVHLLSFKIVAIAVGVLAGLGIVLGLLVLAFVNLKWRGTSVARLKELSRGGETLEVSTADGARLHVEIDRPRTAVPLTVIFLHSLGATSTVWAPQRALLADAKVTRVFYDARGHGRSTWKPLPRDVPGVRQFADDLGRVVDAVAPFGSLVLAGHGLGGMTITALNEVRPDIVSRVAGVFVCSSTAGGLRKSARFGLPDILKPVLPIVRRELPGIVMLMGLLPRFVWRLLGLGPYLLGVRLLSVARVGKPAVRHAAAMAYENGFKALGPGLAVVLQHDERAGVAALGGREFTAVESYRDGLVPFDNQRELAQAVPGARRRIAADSGHAVTLEYADLVNEELKDVVGEAWMATPEGRALLAGPAAVNGAARRPAPRPGPRVEAVPQAVADLGTSAVETLLHTGQGLLKTATGFLGLNDRKDQPRSQT